jgi:hypothetical protein
MSDRLKVRFLTVIWGTRYIEEFARVSLPSYLAAGNLPFIAAETDLEIVVMTSMESRDKFEERDYLDKLKALCPVRYILIDDLITNGNYGVTLTLAYARGIIDSGPEQTNTHFVFMNSDFVLADGSLKTLVAKLREGHHAVMAPSLRACSEAVVPVLIDAVDQADRTLTMSPRPMVQLAFDNLHPTVIGKTITQDFVTCTNHNQIYWQIDQNTLLGRYHLIFMLAIKPEVPMGLVNSYCDYGFIPELVPSGEFAIIDDSDGFFMLELQSAEQEKSYLRCGYTPLEKIAAELSSWTTREHRRFAEVDVVFRSGDLPARLSRVRAEAARYMSELYQHMTPPRDHVDHFYWTSGVQAWASIKFPGEAPVLPPEIADADRLFPQPAPEPHVETSVARGRIVELRARVVELRGRIAELRRLLVQRYIDLMGFVRRSVGVMPDVPIWHCLWLDSRLILDWVNSIAGDAGQNNALVCDDTSPLLLSLRKHMPIERHVSLEELVPGFAIQSSGRDISDQTHRRADGVSVDQKFDHILVHIRRTELVNLRRVLEWVEKCIEPSGTIAVYIENRRSEEYEGNFSLELAQSVQDWLPANWLGLRLDASFAGGRVKRRLRLRERFLFPFMFPSSAGRVPLAMFTGVLWAMVAGLTAWNNFRLRKRSAECLDYCSSALVRLSNRPEVIAPSSSEGRRTAA